jgi:hypothetical protein
LLLALAFAFFTLVALVVGLLLALTPLLTPWERWPLSGWGWADLPRCASPPPWGVSQGARPCWARARIHERAPGFRRSRRGAPVARGRLAAGARDISALREGLAEKPIGRRIREHAAGEIVETIDMARDIASENRRAGPDGRGQVGCCARPCPGSPGAGWPLPKENDVSDETKTGEHDPNAAVRAKVEAAKARVSASGLAKTVRRSSTNILLPCWRAAFSLVRWSPALGPSAVRRRGKSWIRVARAPRRSPRWAPKSRRPMPRAADAGRDGVAKLEDIGGTGRQDRRRWRGRRKRAVDLTEVAVSSAREAGKPRCAALSKLRPDCANNPTRARISHLSHLPFAHHFVSGTHVSSPMEKAAMQKLHLVMGGRVKDPQGLEFVDLNKIDVVGCSPTITAPKKPGALPRNAPWMMRKCAM